MLKHAILALGLAFLVGGTLTRGEVAAPPAVLTNSMATMAAKAEAALTALRIHTLFDQCRQFEDFGVTYQPAVVAPANLASRMGPEQLRMYAGVKLFDAIYAATFLQRQAVAADVKAIEEIQERLDLRSCADLNNRYLETLKQAAAEPEAVDVRRLIQQLSEDYAGEAPALLAHPESAAYLRDALYGFIIESTYVFNELERNDPTGAIREGYEMVDNTDTFRLVLDVFEAFERLEEPIRVGGEARSKLAVIRKMYELDVAEDSGQMTDAEAGAGWAEADAPVAAIRAAILSPQVQ